MDLIHREAWYREALSLPQVRQSVVFHWGTLNPSDKGKRSLEGGGLSVTTHPDEWVRITPLGGKLWRLSKANGAFLDVHSMSQEAKEEILDWGVQEGYLDSRSTFRVTYWDDEMGSDLVAEFETREEAEYEAEDVEAPVEEIPGGFVPTPKLTARTGVLSSIAEAFDHLLTVYVEDNTSLDGVWWEDTVDVSRYSAPRGVIFSRRLPEWEARLLRP